MCSMHAWEVIEEEEYGCVNVSQVTMDEEKSKMQYAFLRSYVRWRKWSYARLKSDQVWTELSYARLISDYG